ncbi:ferredoxin [Gordonia sp. CPCC 205515]|uniref:ferredoxin n=1 Tax=Gordonia sp. CPCC 205515 TaxID=3140791 RepID=UPI003AF38D57
MGLKDRMAGVHPQWSDARIAVDRIACGGHGVCAIVLNNKVTLDEWGYPIIHDDRVESAIGTEAIRLCPKRALRWRRA